METEELIVLAVVAYVLYSRAQAAATTLPAVSATLPASQIIYGPPLPPGTTTDAQGNILVPAFAISSTAAASSYGGNTDPANSSGDTAADSTAFMQDAGNMDI